MARRGRKRKGYRIRGPYKHRRRWRIEIIGVAGKREVESFSTEGKARGRKAELEEEMPRGLTMERAFREYEEYLRHERGCKESTIERTMRRLRAWHDPDTLCDDVTPSMLDRVYKKRVARLAVDSHRNELKEVKSFWHWMGRPIVDDIKPVGRRRRGKPKLRMSETRTLFDKAFELAGKGDDGALAVLAAILLGVRSGEIVDRRVRDVDVTDDGVLFWIDEGKTDSAARPLAGLLARQAAGKNNGDWLFPARKGHRDVGWLRDNVYRLCRLAGVPKVSPQGLRGTHATLTAEAGETSEVIAKALGHAGDTVTKQHYIKPGSAEQARVERMLKVVGGGRENG
jgi:integrase